MCGEDFFLLTSENCPTMISAFYGYHYDGNAISIRANPGTLLEFESAGIFVNIQTIGDRIIIQQDFFCSFGLYIFREKGYWAISNSFYLLARFLSDKFQLTVNDEYIALFLADMIPVSLTETAIREITELAQGEYVVINAQSKELDLERMAWNLANVNMFSPEGIALIDAWHARYSRILRAIIKSGFVLSADLSGGFDSRAAFTALFKPDLYRDAYVYAPNDSIHTHADDYRIAGQIASLYGFPLRKLEASYRRLSPLKAILNSLKTKFFFHTQLYFKSHYFTRPVFNLNGGAGEVFRAMPDWNGENFINIAAPRNTVLGKDIQEPVRRILRRTWEQIKASYPEKIPDAIKIYRYTRVKNHFARTGAESFLCNLISVAPFMDPVLYKLDINPLGVTDRNTFFAFILARFMPDSLAQGFDKGRKFLPETIQFATRFNEEFPYQEKKGGKKFVINSGEKIFSNEYILPGANSATRYFLEIYKSHDVRDFIQNKYGVNIYQDTLAVFDPESYWGFWQSTRLLFEYFLHGIIHKKEGLHCPYSQIYLPQSLIGRNGDLSNHVTKPVLTLKIASNADVLFSDLTSEKGPSTATGVYLDITINSTSHSINIHSKKKGNAQLLIAACGTFFPYTPPYLVDILKLSIFSKSGNRIIAEMNDIFCLGSSPYKMNFSHDEDEEIIITIHAQTNTLWLYSWMTESREVMAQNFASMPAGADNISNQYNH